MTHSSLKCLGNTRVVSGELCQKLNNRAIINQNQNQMDATALINALNLLSGAGQQQSNTVVQNNVADNRYHKVVSVTELRKTKSRTLPTDFYTVSLKIKDEDVQGIGAQVALYKKPTFQNTHPLPFEEINLIDKECQGDMKKVAEELNAQGGVFGRWRTFKIDDYYMKDADGNVMTYDDGRPRTANIARVFLFAGEDDEAGMRLARSGRDFVNVAQSSETGDLNAQVDALVDKGSDPAPPPAPEPPTTK